MLATVARVVVDLARAEELVQEAWLRAVEHWPREGAPEKPGAWLVTAARRLAIDAWRREAVAKREAERARAESTPPSEVDAQLDAALAPELLRDDPLRLMFACCHPLLPRDAQVALTLHTLGGLTVPEIARAFLADERAIAQRLVRAKRTLRARKVAFRVPSAYELPARMPVVLDVLYLVFNEGYAASAGDALVRRELCDEALRLARLVADALPGAEALALAGAVRAAGVAPRRARRRERARAHARATGPLALGPRAHRGRVRGARACAACAAAGRFSAASRDRGVSRARAASRARTGAAS